MGSTVNRWALSVVGWRQRGTRGTPPQIDKDISRFKMADTVACCAPPSWFRKILRVLEYLHMYVNRETSLVVNDGSTLSFLTRPAPPRSWRTSTIPDIEP